jgi:inositol-phosphate transport system ATP-binding protein
LKGWAQGGQLQIGDALLDLNARCDGEVTFGLRPEDIALVTSSEARLEGQVTTVEPMGREVFYTIDTPAGMIHALEYGETIRHAPGDRVGISCKSALTLVFDAAGNRIAGLHADLSHHSTIPAREPEAVN